MNLIVTLFLDIVVIIVCGLLGYKSYQFDHSLIGLIPFPLVAAIVIYWLETDSYRKDRVFFRWLPVILIFFTSTVYGQQYTETFAIESYRLVNGKWVNTDQNDTYRAFQVNVWKNESTLHIDDGAGSEYMFIRLESTGKCNEYLALDEKDRLVRVHMCMDYDPPMISVVYPTLLLKYYLR